MQLMLHLSIQASDPKLLFRYTQFLASFSTNRIPHLFSFSRIASNFMYLLIADGNEALTGILFHTLKASVELLFRMKRSYFPRPLEPWQ